MTCQWLISVLVAGERNSAAWRAGIARIAACAAVFMMAIGMARAADMPNLDDSFLRGSLAPPPSTASAVDWSGVYFGAQLGVSNLNTDFGNSTSSLIAYILRNTTLENEAQPSAWTTLPNSTTNSASYGAFLGYNMQMEKLVLGFDIGYTKPSSFETSASDTISRTVNTSDGYENKVSIQSQSSLKLVDFATVRARAGYAFGQFLPYAVLGAAVARFNYANSATVRATGTDTSGGGGSPYDTGYVTQTDSKDNAIVGGFVAGLGMDVALLPNVFLRGEWEFIAFTPVNGVRSNINTGRVGVALKF